MEIIDFYASTDQNHWLGEIKKSDWSAGQDDIPKPSLTPWIGFVYTFPEYRGKGCIGELLKYAYGLAGNEGHKHIYISTGETGLYEKYGYSFWKMMKDIHGEESRVYITDIVTTDNKDG